MKVIVGGVVGMALVVLSSCSIYIDVYEYGYAKDYHQIPSEFERVEIGGASYWNHGGRYYTHDGERGYLLVKPPRGSEQGAAAGPAAVAAAPPAPTGDPVAAQEESSDSPGGLAGLFTPGGGQARSGPKTRTVGRSPVKRRRLGSD